MHRPSNAAALSPRAASSPSVHRYARVPSTAPAPRGVIDHAPLDSRPRLRPRPRHGRPGRHSRTSGTAAGDRQRGAALERRAARGRARRPARAADDGPGARHRPHLHVRRLGRLRSPRRRHPLRRHPAPAKVGAHAGEQDQRRQLRGASGALRPVPDAGHALRRDAARSRPRSARRLRPASPRPPASATPPATRCSPSVTPTAPTSSAT